MDASVTGTEISANSVFPLPYRVFFLVGLGILGWATNVHGLDKLGIDVVSALDLPPENSASVSPTPFSRFGNHRLAAPSLYRPVYRIFTAYSVLCYISWLVFRVVTRGDVSLVDSFNFIPAISCLLLVFLLVFPVHATVKVERDKFLGAIRRCLFTSGEGAILFSDVVFADIGTSFAKVFADIWLSAWMVMPGNSLLLPPHFENWLRWVVPVIMSLPFSIRFRQCLVEYQHPANASRRPFFNALKYATSFPVIFLSAVQRSISLTQAENHIFGLWVLSAIVNTVYSFWWDVSNDWGLNFFGMKHKKHSLPSSGLSHIKSTMETGSLHIPASNGIDQPLHLQAREAQLSPSRAYPFGLRPKLVYPFPVYFILILANLLLRMTWSLKLSSHLHTTTRHGSIAFFWLEVAEMVRRWLWVFLRVEWEVIKRLGGDPKAEPHDTIRTDVYELTVANSDDNGRYLKLVSV